jgi:hypothetical protein
VREKYTWNKTDVREKPKLAEYLVMIQLLVDQTAVESHGHTLGLIVCVMRSYCAACKAGGGGGCATTEDPCCGCSTCTGVKDARLQSQLPLLFVPRSLVLEVKVIA